MKVNVYYKHSAYQIDLPADANVDGLNASVADLICEKDFELLGLPQPFFSPERPSFAAGGMQDSDMLTIVVVPKSRTAVEVPAVALSVMSPPPASQQLQSFSVLLNTTCTAGLLTRDPVQQPAFSVAGRMVCSHCAAHCAGSTPAEAVQSLVFVCQCEDCREGTTPIDENRRAPLTRFLANETQSHDACVHMRAGGEIPRSRADPHVQMDEPLREVDPIPNPMSIPKPVDNIQREIAQRIQVQLQIYKLYRDQKVRVQYLLALPLTQILPSLPGHPRSLPEVFAGPASTESLFVHALLKWFKRTFQWVKSVQCDNPQCSGGACRNIGRDRANAAEQAFIASVVEIWQCPACRKTIRFPRYNHPLALINTKRGRCGEWANAFTCLLTALGFRTRFVLDFTDHVWTEFYSRENGRWIHLDCCEPLFDRPLVYEKGWGKSLSFIFAISDEAVVDVMPRYTRDPSAVTAARNCDEQWLESFLLGVTQKVSGSRFGKVWEDLQSERDELAAYFRGVDRKVYAEEQRRRISGANMM